MGHFLTGDLEKMPFKKTILIFRVLGTGALYFVLASVEVPTILAEFTGFTTRTKEKIFLVPHISSDSVPSQACLRVIHPKNDPSNKTLLAAVPLAVIDASICW